MLKLRYFFNFLALTVLKSDKVVGYGTINVEIHVLVHSKTEDKSAETTVVTG